MIQSMADTFGFHTIDDGSTVPSEISLPRASVLTGWGPFSPFLSM